MIRDTYIITSKERKFVFIVLSIIIVVLIVDTSIVKVYRFITPPLSTEWDIVTFTAITIVYTVVQYLLLRLVKTQARTSRLFALDLLHKVVFLIQCSLTALLIFVILQMIIISAYNTVIVLAAVTISYTLSIIMAGLLTFRFYQWFKSSRNIVILAYGIAAALLSINAGFTLVYVSYTLLSVTPNVMPHIGSIFVFSTYSAVLNSGYVLSSIVSFMAMWIATILLLRHHSKKLGVVKYWILLYHLYIF